MPCNNLISDSTIGNIYKDDNLITNVEVRSSCVNSNTKKTKVLIENNGTILLERPIERTYFKEKELFSPTKSHDIGKVVNHDYFILKNEFQGKKIISKIHPKELEAYRAYEFKEIHLDAAWAGLIVWKKMFYKFQSKREESLIVIAIQRYLKEVKGMSVKQIADTIKNDPFSIGFNYLKDKNNPQNDFSNWIYNTSCGIGLAKMYKEVS